MGWGRVGLNCPEPSMPGKGIQIWLRVDGGVTEGSLALCVVQDKR